ncbi:uncharacterized protein LOC144721534 isoform X1 [Lampetra planeri]
MMTTTTMMASWCRSPRCSAERRGFRRELDSWRHKLIHCIGFESILEGLYGPGLLRDLSLFDDCEPEEVSDWIVDENCPFCCLRRDKVKEHLSSPSDVDGASDSTDTAEQLERETETFLHALFQRKDPPRACNPAIPLVAREIMYRMIRQFAAEYAQRRDAAAAEKDGCETSPMAPPPAADAATSVPSAKPSCPTSSGTTLAVPSDLEHKAESPPQEPAAIPVKGTAPTPLADDSILSKLLSTQDEHTADEEEEEEEDEKDDEDGPLDLSLGKNTQDCKYDQAGVLDLSTKKSMDASKSPSAKASAAGVAGKVLMIKEDSSSYNGVFQNSTLYLILLKLCPLHQHLLVVVLKCLAEDYRSKCKSSNSTMGKKPCMSAFSDCKVLCWHQTKFPFNESCNESRSGCPTGQQLAKASRASFNASVLSNTSNYNSKDSDKRYCTRTRTEPRRRSFRRLAKSNAESLKHQSELLPHGPVQVNCRRSCCTAPRARQLRRGKSPSPPTLSPVDSLDELEDCDFNQTSKIALRKSRPPRLVPQDDRGESPHSSGSETLGCSHNFTAVHTRGLKAVHNGESDRGSSERYSEKDSLESTVLVDELMDRINLRLQTIETTVQIDGSNLVSKLSESSNENNGKRLLDDITSLMQCTNDKKRDYSLVDLLRKHEIHVVQTRLRRRRQNLGTLPQTLCSPTNAASHRRPAMQVKNTLSDLNSTFSLTPFHATEEPSTDATWEGDDGTDIDCADKESKFDSLPPESTDWKPAIRWPSIKINSREFYPAPSEDSDVIYVDNIPDELSYSEINFKSMRRSTARKSTRGNVSGQECYEMQTIWLKSTADTSENDVEPHQPQENGIYSKEHMEAPINGMVDIPPCKQENCNFENGEQPLCKHGRVSCISETQTSLKAENDSSKRVPGPRKSSRLILKERADAKTNERIPLNSRHNVNGHEKLMDENTQADEKFASFTKRSEGSAEHQSSENSAAVNTSTEHAEATGSGHYQLPCQQNTLTDDAVGLSTCSTLCSSRESIRSEFKGKLCHDQCVQGRKNVAGNVCTQTGDAPTIKGGTGEVEFTENATTSQSSPAVPLRDGASSTAWKSFAKASNNVSATPRSPVTSDQRTLRSSRRRHTQSAAVDERGTELRTKSPSQTDLSGKEKVEDCELDLERRPGALDHAGRMAIESSSTVQERQPHDARTDSLTPTDETSLKVKTSLNVKCPDEAQERHNREECGLKEEDMQMLFICMCSHDSNGDQNHPKAKINSTCDKKLRGIVVVDEDVQFQGNVMPQGDIPPCSVCLNADCSRECLQPCHSESEARGDVQISLEPDSNDRSSSFFELKSSCTMESPPNDTGTSTPSSDGAKWSRSEYMKLLWKKRHNILASKITCSKNVEDAGEQTPENNNSLISKLGPRLFYESSLLNISTKPPICKSHRSSTSVYSSQTQSTSEEQMHELHISELSNNLANPEVSILGEDVQQNVNRGDGKMQTRSQIRALELPEDRLQEQFLHHMVSEKNSNETHSLSDNCTVLKNVFTQEIEMYNYATQPSAQSSIFHTFTPDTRSECYGAVSIGPTLHFAGEYFVQQELVDSINEQYENINHGWIPVKNCNLLAKGKSKSERKKDVWLMGKKRTKKVTSRRIPLIQQLFSSSCSLPKLQEWFLESTETRPLPILSKANARDPFSVLQASREKKTQMSDGQSFALTAKCDRMEKHLKKFALTASKAQKIPSKQNTKKVVYKTKLIPESQGKGEDCAECVNKNKNPKRTVTPTSAKERITNAPVRKEKAHSLQNSKPKPSRNATENKLTAKVSQGSKSSDENGTRVCQQKWLQGERISKKYMNMRGKATWTGAHCGKVARLPRELKALLEDDVHKNLPAAGNQRFGVRKSRMQSVDSPRPMLSIGMKDLRLQNKSKSSRTNSGSPLKDSEPPSKGAHTKTKECSTDGDPASLRAPKAVARVDGEYVDSRTVSHSLKSRRALQGKEAARIPSKSSQFAAALLRPSRLGDAERKRRHDDMPHASAKKMHLVLRACKKT